MGRGHAIRRFGEALDPRWHGARRQKKEHGDIGGCVGNNVKAYWRSGFDGPPRPSDRYGRSDGESGDHADRIGQARNGSCIHAVLPGNQQGIGAAREIEEFIRGVCLVGKIQAGVIIACDV